MAIFMLIILSTQRNLVHVVHNIIFQLVIDDQL